MKVYIGADHRGFPLKEKIKTILQELDISYEDLGNDILDPDDDFPVFAEKVAQTVASTPNSLGIVLCGSGVGVDIVANKIPGIRSGFAFSVEQISSARKDDDINVLSIAADQINKDDLPGMIQAFLQTSYASTEKHERRLHEIEKLEHE